MNLQTHKADWWSSCAISPWRRKERCLAKHGEGRMEVEFRDWSHGWRNGGEMWLGFWICEDVWREKRENGKVEDEKWDGSEGMYQMKLVRD